MKEIVIISGKGGTGKTSVTSSFAVLAGEKTIIADCDVDAADMHILMEPDFSETEDFYSGELAVINQETCTQCGICADVCRFDAIPVIKGKYIVDELSCEGCGYCARVCPAGAITNVDLKVGQWFVSNVKTNTLMVHAKLGIGADNSGKLVTQVKNEAKRLAKEHNKDYILIDGSPGVGCPVVSSLSGAHLVVLVTEPPVSALHDLKRVYQLVKKFQIKATCIINKWDINKKISNEIKEYLKKEEILHIADLPYEESFTKAMVEGKSVVEIGDSKVAEILKNSWEKIQQIVN
jgi:MinD superfamily P-loop ATPase